jgi:hypothetical protein
VERVFGSLLALVALVDNFFGGMRPNRYDDAVLVEVKARRRQLFLSVVSLVAALLVVGLALPAFLGGLAASPILRPFAGALGEYASVASLVLIGSLVAWALVSGYRYEHYVRRYE